MKDPLKPTQDDEAGNATTVIRAYTPTSTKPAKAIQSIRIGEVNIFHDAIDFTPEELDTEQQGDHNH